MDGPDATELSDIGPLRGRRIAITRAREQSQELRTKLETLGAEVVVAPAIEIAPPDSFAPLDSALRNIAGYRWLVLTSANGARALGERMALLGLGIPDFAHLHFAAIGAATAAAIRQLGFEVDLVPENYVAESLVQVLRERTRGHRVLLVRARVGRDVLPDELRRSGVHVEVVDAYQTVMPAGAPEQLRSMLGGQPRLDAVLFASSSAVKNFLAILSETQRERPEGLLAISIGPVTSATLREHGWPPAAEAGASTVDGLVEACVAACFEPPHSSG